jgi:hypothetical protein
MLDTTPLSPDLSIFSWLSLRSNDAANEAFILSKLLQNISLQINNYRPRKYLSKLIVISGILIAATVLVILFSTNTPNQTAIPNQTTIIPNTANYEIRQNNVVNDIFGINGGVNVDQGLDILDHNIATSTEISIAALDIQEAIQKMDPRNFAEIAQRLRLSHGKHPVSARFVEGISSPGIFRESLFTTLREISK